MINKLYEQLREQEKPDPEDIDFGPGSRNVEIFLQDKNVLMIDFKLSIRKYLIDVIAEIFIDSLALNEVAESILRIYGVNRIDFDYTTLEEEDYDFLVSDVEEIVQRELDQIVLTLRAND